MISIVTCSYFLEHGEKFCLHSDIFLYLYAHSGSSVYLDLQECCSGFCSAMAESDWSGSLLCLLPFGHIRLAEDAGEVDYKYNS